MAPTNQNPKHPLEGEPDGPSIAPPPGLIPNFDNPPNLNNLVRAVLVVILVITTIVVFLRVWSRVILRRVDLPTILALVAFALQIAFISISFRLTDTYGLFVHMWDVRLKDFPAVNQLFFQNTILYFSISLIIKPAILLDWISIFCPAKTRNLFFWSSCTIMAIHILLNISYIVVELAACYPFEKNWNLLLPGKCINVIAITVGAPIANLVFDVIIFLLPQKVIWGLQMRFWVKIGTSFVFAVGLLACIVAAFRLYSSLQYNGSWDITYTFSSVGLWSLAEMTSGFILGRYFKSRGTSIQSFVGASATGFISGLAYKRSKLSMTQIEDGNEQKDSCSTSPMSTNNTNRGSNIHLGAGKGKGDSRINDNSIIRTEQFTAIEAHQPEDIIQDEHIQQHSQIANQ
ncbi:hypothetical protein F4680DRAFT_468733 [Xylaria scruposa]|nr:hypothetical protein F4680DRAFT_468733 [Xylaria scruposa]